MSSSKLEALFATQVKALKLPCPECEYRFHPVRRWRFDMAWPDQKIAVEIEGGAWANGRHQRGKGFIEDMNKYNTATKDGWRVFRFSGDHVKSGEAVNMISEVLNG